MIKDVKVYLDDIVKSCEKIASYTKNTNKVDFDNDDKLQDAIIRRLEIIGEAIKRIPQDFCNVHSEIEWRKATGMRDILIHHYDEVETDQIWITVMNVLPDFKNQIKNLLQSLDNKNNE